MPWQPTKDAVQRLWGRRWVRRISYTVVAGATVLTITPWLARRPAILRWAVGRIDAVVQEETGLPLTIGQIEIHPVLGSVVFHDITLGGDLLTIQKAEFQAELWSLLGPTRHIYAVRLEHPHLRLTEAGLAAIKLKVRPPRTTPLPQFRLDRFSLTGGEIDVPEPLRGLPPLHYGFDVKGTGMGPNHVRVQLTGPQLTVKGPGGWEKGRLDLKGEASEPVLVLQEAYLHLGESQVRLNGRYEASTPKAADRMEASLTGLLNLTQAFRWGAFSKPPMTGDLDLAGTLNGSMAHPQWTFAAAGQKLDPSRACSRLP